MSDTTPSAAALTEVTFLSGITSTGSLATQSYWTWNNNNPATYSATSEAHKWSNNSSGHDTGLTSAAGTAGGTVTYAFDSSISWTAAQQQAFVASLTVWSDEANIKFQLVSNSASADVLLTLDDGQGTYEESAPAVSGTEGTKNVPDEVTPGASGGGQAIISFDTLGDYGTLGSFSAEGGYSYAALVHEAGHLMGLGHAGPYNEGSSSNNADTAQLTAFDSRQWSAMSYIDPGDTAAAYYDDYTVTGTDWTITSRTTLSGGQVETTSVEGAPETPQMLDILAVQRIYGAPTSTALSGGQIFGFNCNITDASEPLFDFSKNTQPIITIWDAGTHNTLDLSGFTTASEVDLQAGSFSSVAGLTNNVGIAYGTTIDTAIGGSGNDSFVVNADADTINGGGGSNTVIFTGAESLYSILRSGSTIGVTLKSSGVTDILTNIQELSFTDRTVASDSLPCFAAGTRIATPEGEVAVERLRPGDQVLAWRAEGCAAARLRWVGSRRVRIACHPRPAEVRPIRIAAHAFAPGAPSRPLLLSPEHAVFVDDALIPVRYLVNGTSVAFEDCSEITYWHVELDSHDILLADGLTCESYLDTGTRSSFAGGAVTRLHPVFSPGERTEAIWEAFGCAKLHVSGPAVTRVAARLRRRSTALGLGTPPRPAAAPTLRARSHRPDALLDAAWYALIYPDVAQSRCDAATHYDSTGRAEGRLPCPEPELLRGLGLIDAGTVHVTMSDVVAAGCDPAVHFCNHGWREGRRPNPCFDTDWYRVIHAVPADMNPLLHYVLVGEPAGMRPGRHFDPAWYGRQHRLAPGISALSHYLAHRRRGRVAPVPGFDLAGYVRRHAEELRAGRDPYAHYLARAARRAA